MEAGKLYICEEYFLMLYPDPETAAAVGATAFTDAPAGTADYWSNQFGKPVLYAKKNIPLLVLNNKEEYVEVLAGDRKGWIVIEDWLELKEIDYA